MRSDSAKWSGTPPGAIAASIADMELGTPQAAVDALVAEARRGGDYASAEVPVVSSDGAVFGWPGFARVNLATPQQDASTITARVAALVGAAA